MENNFNPDEPVKEYTGVWIPREVWEHPELSNTDIRCYGEIAGFNEFYGSNAWLAKKMNCSEKTASRAICNLLSLGLLENCGFNGRFRKLRVVRDFPKSQEDWTKMSNQTGQKCPSRLDENVQHNNTSIINKSNKQVNNTSKPTAVAVRAKETETAVSNNPNSVLISHWRKVMGDLNADGKNLRAMKLLRKKYDVPTICRVIDALPEMMSQPYETRVADFVDLYSRWNKVMDWGRRRMIEQQKNQQEAEEMEEYNPFGKYEERLKERSRKKRL